MSSRKLVVEAAAVWALPEASVWVAVTVMVLLPRSLRSCALKTTACSLPVPVRGLVTLLAPLVKVTLTAAPLSAVTLTTPVVCVASALVAPSAPVVTPVPRASVGAEGGLVSSRKLVVEAAAVWALPEASVWVAVTVMVLLPRSLRSCALKTTACSLPVPVRGLVTLLAPLVKVTLTAAPLSAVTLTTPVVCVASALVAPSVPVVTPVPKLSVGAEGGVVSATPTV